MSTSRRWRSVRRLSTIGLALAWLALAASPAGAAYVFERQWGGLGSGDGQFLGPVDVTVDPVLAQVFVADLSNDRIQRFDSQGNFLSKWGVRGSGDGQLRLPQGVAASSGGIVFVADTGNERIQAFSRTGGFIRRWGSEGSGNGQFELPNGIAVHDSGVVFVTDAQNKRVQRFDTEGNFLGKWGSEGSGDGQFAGDLSPIDAAVSPFFGVPYVVDTGNHRIQAFSPVGAFGFEWGGGGSGDGLFLSPFAIAVDSSGDIYVADGLNHRIQKFDSSGSFITKWGSSGSGPGQFNQPAGITVDGDGNVYVADRFNQRIQKFRIVLPQTRFTSGPPAVTSDPTPAFRFTVDRRPLGASFRCSVDGAAFEACSSPRTVGPLADGEHSFRVRGTDGDGHTSPTSAERGFTVDTEVTIGIEVKRLAVNRRRVARARLRCPASEASPPCVGTLALKTRRKLRFKGRRRRVVLARSTEFGIDAGETERARLRLSKPKWRLIRRRKQARQGVLIAQVGDGAGNRATERKRLRVRAQ